MCVCCPKIQIFFLVWTNLKFSFFFCVHKFKNKLVVLQTEMQCHRCKKFLKCKQNLKRHLAKTLPCDFKCRECDAEAFSDRFSYYRHCKKEHPKDEPALELVEEDVVPCSTRLRPQDIIPLDDFHELYLQMLKKANEDNCEININLNLNINIRPIQNEERLTKTRKSLGNSAYMSSLQTLTESRPLEKVAVDVLEKVHANDSRPENNSICMADSSRKTAKIYSRIEDDRCGWILHQKKDCMQRLNSHTTGLLHILLEEAVKKLRDAALIPNYQKRKEMNMVQRSDQIACLFLQSDMEFVAIFLDDFARLDQDPLRVEYVHQDDLFSPRNMESKQYDLLRQSINDRKEHILTQLKNLVLDEKHLIEFLKRSRSACLKNHSAGTLSSNALKTL